MRRFLKRTVIIVIVMAAIAISFTTKYNSLLDEFKSTGNSKQSSINDYLLLSSSFMENMTTYGNSNNISIKDSQYLSVIKYDPATNSYNMDLIGGTSLQKSIGNLTGVGTIPKDGINRDELNMVFEYTKYFNEFIKRLPDVAWLYYTSENNFIYMAPWVSSSDFKYSKELKKAEFYEYVNPEFNPDRKAKWTPVYMDHAGKGLMVTLSSPVYRDNKFLGVFSLDLTNEKFSEIISSHYESYLIDNTDSIIATTGKVEDHVVTSIGNMIKAPESDIKKMKGISDGEVRKVGMYFVYAGNFKDAPWKLLVLVPVYVILGKALLNTVPLFIICLLLFRTYREVETRKKTELMLQNIAVTDQLTALNNRHCFDLKVVEEMELSDRYNKPLSMILFDLDFFKRINDNFGHPIGDDVLKQTSEITGSALRKSDMLFRVGGEEFAVLLPDTDINGAMEVAEKLRSALDDNIHPLVGKYTASFGVGERSKNESLKIWYKEVDDALYEAKRQGRNRVIRSMDSSAEPKHT